MYISCTTFVLPRMYTRTYVHMCITTVCQLTLLPTSLPIHKYIHTYVRMYGILTHSVENVSMYVRTRRSLGVCIRWDHTYISTYVRMYGILVHSVENVSMYGKVFWSLH